MRHSLSAARKNKTPASLKLQGFILVEVKGFEPPTSCSQSRRASQLRYTSVLFDLEHYNKSGFNLQRVLRSGSLLITVKSLLRDKRVARRVRPKSAIAEICTRGGAKGGPAGGIFTIWGQGWP